MSFDVNSFLEASVTSALDTKTIPCPIGEFQGIIEKILPRQWTSKDGTSSGLALDILWMVEDEEVKRLLDRPTVIVKQGIMLDMTNDGKLDTAKGKNIALGRLREAVGMNVEGQAFSFSMLPGLAGKITVSHREDPKSGDTFAEVKSVTNL